VQEVMPEFLDSSETGIMVYLSILGMPHYIMVFTTQRVKGEEFGPAHKSLLKFLNGSKTGTIIYSLYLERSIT
jgi:hypothetical protein